MPRQVCAGAPRPGRRRRGHEPGRLAPCGAPPASGHRTGTAIFPGGTLVPDVLITGGEAVVLSRPLPAGWLFTSRDGHMNDPARLSPVMGAEPVITVLDQRGARISA